MPSLIETTPRATSASTTLLSTSIHEAVPWIFNASTNNVQELGWKRKLIDVDAEWKLSVAWDLMREYDVTALPVYGLGVGRLSISGQEEDMDPPAKKGYIGIITVLDIVLFLLSETSRLNTTISSSSNKDTITQALQCTPIAAILGETKESAYLKILSSDASFYELVQLLVSGSHRVLVRHLNRENENENIDQNDHEEAYQIVTQADAIRAVHQHSESDSLMQELLSMNLTELTLANEPQHQHHSNTARGVGFVMVIQHDWSTQKAIRFMAENYIHACAVVKEDNTLVGTLSLSDLRNALVPLLVPDLKVTDFLKLSHRVGSVDMLPHTIVARPSDTLKYVMEKVLENRVHRVWIIDENADGGGVGEGTWKPTDVVTMTDMLGVVLGVGVPSAY